MKFNFYKLCFWKKQWYAEKEFIKVLSNTDHMTPIPFGHFAIVFTS